MHWIARVYSFPNVKTLGVKLHRNNWRNEQPLYGEHASHFFQSFSSLEDLSIDGPMESSILTTVLCQHGQTLRKLDLKPNEAATYGTGHQLKNVIFEFSKDHILQIGTQCPVLEELTIPGKAQQVQLI